MNIDLVPLIRPSQFSDECAHPGERLFDPVLFDGGSKILAGGPRLLAVFSTKGGRPLLEMACNTEAGFAGFCMFEGTIYIQDGPVLAAWSSIERKCIAARNLSTRDIWDRQGDTPDQAFYSYSDEDQPAATRLQSARNRYAWASLLVELDLLPGAQVRQASAGIRKLLDVSEINALQASEAERAHLDSTLKSAANIVFSAPVTRRYRRSGASANIVFTLGMNGSLYAMDERLQEVAQVTRGADLPLRAELTIAEPLDASGAHLCRLYYMTASGAITVLDGASSDLNALQGWAAKGTVDAAKALPLTWHDGVLMGGGILGVDFFATPADAPDTLARQVAAPAGGWTGYQVDSKNKLVVLTNGTASRLHAYGTGAVVHDRWSLRQTGPVHLVLPQPDAGAAQLPWVVETDVGSANGGPPQLRVLYANSVDSPGNSPVYRPSAVELASGSLGPYNINPPFAYGWIRSRPLANATHLFCVLREKKPDLLLAAASGADSADYNVEQLLLQLSQRLDSPLLRDQAGLPAPAAVSTTRDALASFDLSTRIVSLTELAMAERQRMEDWANLMPAALITLACVAQGLGINPRSEEYGPEPMRNATLVLDLKPGGKRTVKTDGNGVVHLNLASLGAEFTIAEESRRAARSPLRMKVEYVDASTVKFVSGPLPTLRLMLGGSTGRP